MTRRILRFLGLKVAEAGAFLGIPFGIGKLVFLCPAFVNWAEIKGTGFWSIWAAGFSGLIFLIGAVIVVIAFVLFVLKNWEWAE